MKGPEYTLRPVDIHGSAANRMTNAIPLRLPESLLLLQERLDCVSLDIPVGFQNAVKLYQRISDLPRPEVLQEICLSSNLTHYKGGIPSRMRECPSRVRLRLRVAIHSWCCASQAPMSPSNTPNITTPGFTEMSSGFSRRC